MMHLSVGSVLKCTKKTILYKESDYVYIDKVYESSGDNRYRIIPLSKDKIIAKRTMGYVMEYFEKVHDMTDKEYFAFKMTGKLPA